MGQGRLVPRPSLPVSRAAPACGGEGRLLPAPTVWGCWGLMVSTSTALGGSIVSSTLPLEGFAQSVRPEDPSPVVYSGLQLWAWVPWSITPSPKQQVPVSYAGQGMSEQAPARGPGPGTRHSLYHWILLKASEMEGGESYTPVPLCHPMV